MDDSLGLLTGTVKLVPYQSDWPKRFEAEAARLRAALGPMILGLEHVGSTAVPGLAAKPIIDITHFALRVFLRQRLRSAVTVDYYASFAVLGTSLDSHQSAKCVDMCLGVAFMNTAQ